jgi:hypothetical protein
LISFPQLIISKNPALFESIRLAARSKAGPHLNGMGYAWNKGSVSYVVRTAAPPSRHIIVLYTTRYVIRAGVPYKVGMCDCPCLTFGVRQRCGVLKRDISHKRASVCRAI